MLSNILKGAGKDALIYFPVRFLPALTSLVTVPVFTRMIGAEDYGFFYLVSSASSFAATIATAWLTPAVVRYYWMYSRERRLDEYTGTTLWLSLASIGGTTLAATVLALALAPMLDPGLVRLLPAALGGFAVSSLMQVLLQVQRAANKAKSYAILSVLVTLATTAVSLWLVWSAGIGSLGILLGGLVGNAVALPFALKAAGKHGSLSPARARKDITRQYLTYGTPFIAANLSSWSLVLADRYIIGWLRTAAEVGLYSVAYGLGEKIMQLVTIPLMMTMGPVMIETFEKHGQELAVKVQTQFTRYYLLVTLPLVFGMAAIAEDFMGVFTGEEFRVAYPVLWVVSASVMLYGLTQIAGTGVTLHRKSKIIMTNTLAAAGVNVVGNLALVPAYGYMGAAWMTLLSYLFLLGLTWWRSRPYMRWQVPWPSVGRITAACLVMMAAVMLALPQGDPSVMRLVLQVLLGAAVYAIAVFALREIRPDERAVLTGLVRRKRD